MGRGSNAGPAQDDVREQNLEFFNRVLFVCLISDNAQHRCVCVSTLKPLITFPKQAKPREQTENYAKRITPFYVRSSLSFVFMYMP